MTTSGNRIICKGCVIVYDDFVKWKRSWEPKGIIGYKPFPGGPVKAVRINRYNDEDRIECLKDTENKLNLIYREAHKRQIKKKICQQKHKNS